MGIHWKLNILGMKFFEKYFKGDRAIWIVVLFLATISLLAVYSSTGSLAYRYQEGDTAHYLFSQLRHFLFGLVIIFVVHLIPYKFYSPLSTFLLLFSIPLLLVTLLFGANLNQASRWLVLPGLDITIQSSDIAKVALVMYVARILSRNQNTIKDFKGTFLPLIVPVSLVCLLILPANFSTAALVGLTCWLMMFVGRVSLKYLFGFTGLGVLLIAVFVVVMLKTGSVSRVGTWQNRIENFMSDDGGDGNYQAVQSKIAIASGGLVGKGPGNSTQRNFLPHPYSDFIFAIVVEEYGLIGGTFVLMLYLIMLFRAGLIIKKAKRTFPAFLAMGLALILVLQAMVNMSVAVNLIPVTGQPLPLVSMGGTSLLITSASIGIILSISRTLNKNELFDGEEEGKDNS